MSSENSESERRSHSRGGSPSCSNPEDVQCTTYPGIRIRDGISWKQIWPGVLSKQEKKALIDEYSISQWICGVVILRDKKNNPLNNSVPIVECVEHCFDEYLVVGELSERNVHHSHFLCKSVRRVDSARRSIIDYFSNSEYNIEICKLATCRHWPGMFGYLLKNPLMTYTSNYNLASLAYTMIETGECIKYLKQNKEPEMKPIVLTIKKIIEKNDCSTTECVFRCGSRELIPFLHQSTLTSIINNCLLHKQSTFQIWDPKSFKYCPDKDPEIIHRILSYQDIPVKDFDIIFWKWINQENGKKNTLILIGPSNTGKTSFIRGLAELIPSGNIVNTSSPFFAEGLCGAKLGIWEEPLLMPEQADTFKQIAEGTPITLAQKFKKPFYHPGCPIIITTNHILTRFCSSEEIAFNNRCETFNFNNCVSSFRGSCSESCIYSRQQQRRSTPCYLSWSPSSGNSYGKSEVSSSGIGSTSSQRISNCGRWWCGSYHGRRCSHCSGTEEQRTESGRFNISTSTTTSRNNRPSERNETRSSGNRIRSGNTEHLPGSSIESGNSSGGDTEPISKWRRDGMGFRRIGGNDREIEQPTEKRIQISGGWGRGQSSETSTEEQKITTREICSCIIEPSKWDWQAYLAYLASKWHQ